MGNGFFRFQQFTVWQNDCAMKVCTDSCVFGAWVAKHPLIKALNPTFVLDAGTGTGLLSLMFAQHQKQANILAVELDAAAAAQAEKNINESPFVHQIVIQHKDFLRVDNELYDCIICNPPFYEEQLPSPNKQINQARHNVGLTLSQLAEKTESLLKSTGYIAVLFPYVREAEVISVFAGHNMHAVEICRLKQSCNAPFWRSMFILGKKNIPEPNITEIAIHNEAAYSTEFKKLLSGFYLGL